MDCTSFSRLTCWCLDMSWDTPSSIWSGTWYILRYIVIAGDVARGCAQLLSTSLTVKIDGKKKKKKERNWGVFFLSFLFFFEKRTQSSKLKDLSLILANRWWDVQWLLSMIHRYRTYFSLFITFVAAFNYRFMYGIFTIKLWVEKGK